jgi:Na+/H+ antiporter NhaD/arsenite permease-like protein
LKGVVLEASETAEVDESGLESGGSIKEREAARTTRASRQVTVGILIGIAFYLILLFLGVVPEAHVGVPVETQAGHPETVHEAISFVPSLWAVLPFVSLLLAIAILPLIPTTEHWWHHNRNRFLVAASLGFVTLVYYGLVHPGGMENHLTHSPLSHAGWETVAAVFSNAIFSEFIPFIILLFSLYVISGGINLRGDLPAHPGINCLFIGSGALLASFIGTTGAAMVLIRPLLSTNAERRHKVHTVVFFIFVVCNCGGLLLPIGDPPLFLGYLRGVPFTWTLSLWPYWLGVNLALLGIYYVWDRVMYSREEIRAILRDEAVIRPLAISGNINFLFLLGVVLLVAAVIPGKPLFGTPFETPHFLRETLMLVLVVASLQFTRTEVRVRNRFEYHAIIEVAALFSGIFLCMQVPIEILHAKGSSLGIDSARSFFWATGALSSFLDNAPTYVVFFETATSLPARAASSMVELADGDSILGTYLAAISLGAVFMGANTYIGNGPNFMVKSIAEQSGVKMPSFFGFMGYSLLILVPIWTVLTFVI